MLKAVLVDDEIWVRRDLETLLGECEQVELVGSFADGCEALSFLREHPCDVVFTDLRMGRMGGRQLIAACASEQIDVYMVIISAYSDFDAAREGIQYGVIDYLLKPVSRTDFAQLLSRIDERMRSAPKRSSDTEHMRRIEAAYPVCRALCFPMQCGELHAQLAALARFDTDYALYMADQTESGYAVALLGSSLGDLPPLRCHERWESAPRRRIFPP
ncbi:MAG: response regulator [Clostridia bacterium]|nr:response regulator [Clostridia bacterium]